MTPDKSTFIAVCPRTGIHIRPATDLEIAAYLDQPHGHPLAVNDPNIARAFRRPQRVGDVLVDEDTGPGTWYDGAGF